MNYGGYQKQDRFTNCNIICLPIPILVRFFYQHNLNMKHIYLSYLLQFHICFCWLCQQRTKTIVFPVLADFCKNSVHTDVILHSLTTTCRYITCNLQYSHIHVHKSALNFRLANTLIRRRWGVGRVGRSGGRAQFVEPTALSLLYNCSCSLEQLYSLNIGIRLFRGA